LIKKFKIGLLISSYSIDKHYYNLIKNLDKQEDVELVILHTINQFPKKSFLSKIKTLLFLRGFKLIDDIALQLLYKYEKFISKIPNDSYLNIQDFSLKKVNLNCDLSQSKIIIRYDDKEISKIKGLELDLIIKVNTQGIFKGKILKVSKLGIISIHNGDNRWNRGGPGGFWEVYHKKPSTGFIIQKLNDELDGGDVIYRGEFSTHKIFSKNHEYLYQSSVFYLNKVIDKIIRNKILPKSEDNFLYSGKLFFNPTFREVLIYFINVHMHLIRSYLTKKEEWSLRYTNKPINETSIRKFKIIKNQKNSWFADPFIFKKLGKNYFFVEEYFKDEKKACISCLEVNNEKVEYLGKVIEEDFHLSYPFIFEYKEEVYIIPDSCNNRSIRLYKAIEFPMKWEYQYDLLKNISATDTNILFHNEKYWLFTSVDEQNQHRHESRLHIFHADNPLSHNWTEHKMSPVLHKNGARNGGRLKLGNNLIRVGQKYGFQNYGESLEVYKVISLNENIYEEERINSIGTDFDDNITGIHHVDNNEDYIVVDTCKKSI